MKFTMEYGNEQYTPKIHTKDIYNKTSYSFSKREIRSLPKSSYLLVSQKKVRTSLSDISSQVQFS